MDQDKIPGCSPLCCLILLIYACFTVLLAGCAAVDQNPVRVEVVSPSPINNKLIIEEPLPKEKKTYPNINQSNKKENPIPLPSQEARNAPPPPVKTAAENINMAEDNIEAILQASLNEDHCPTISSDAPVSPEDIIANYETETHQNQPSSSYILHPGDIIEISVTGEDLSREIILPPDGIISFFLIDPIPATGRSVEELRLEVENRLSETLPGATVIIRGKTLAAGAAEIIGAVNLPGYKQVQSGDKLSDLLAKAGGLRYFSPDDETVDPALEADPANAFFVRVGKRLAIDLFAFLEEDSLENNPAIQPGDFLYIPRRDRQGIAVIGEVNRPVNLDFREDLTIQDAVSLAGGIRQNIFGNEIFLVRGTLNNLEVMRIAYQAITNGIEEDIALLPGDILFMPKNFILDVSKLPIILLPQLDTLLRNESMD